MTNTTIAYKLDLLAEFGSEKDSIEAHKRDLLDDVKVPAEVEAIVKAGMTQVAAVERGYYAKFDEINRHVAEQLASSLDGRFVVFIPVVTHRWRKGRIFRFIGHAAVP